jgi:hypothetical protein
MENKKQEKRMQKNQKRGNKYQKINTFIHANKAQFSGCRVA